MKRGVRRGPLDARLLTPPLRRVVGPWLYKRPPGQTQDMDRAPRLGHHHVAQRDLPDRVAARQFMKWKEAESLESCK